MCSERQIKDILIENAKNDNAAFVEEMSIPNGKCDLVVVRANETQPVCFEIKSTKDTADENILTQLEKYLEVFGNVTVVCADNHTKKLVGILADSDIAPFVSVYQISDTGVISMVSMGSQTYRDERGCYSLYWSLLKTERKELMAYLRLPVFLEPDSALWDEKAYVSFVESDFGGKADVVRCFLARRVKEISRRDRN